jgi:7-cyano-7-deazaguanine synthase
LGTLAANPFPDADHEFFTGFSALAGRALGCPLTVLTPFAGRAKYEILEIGRQLALDLTFSCIAPRSERHCGRCNKCAERRLAFRELSIADTTEYATS